MKNQNESPDAQKIVLGQTMVTVFRKTIDERSKRETTAEIHRGVVVQDTGAFYRVYNPERGGDTAQENAELFPIASDLIWCAVTGMLKGFRAVPLSVFLKN